MKKVQIGRSRMAEELARPTWEASSKPVREHNSCANYFSIYFTNSTTNRISSMMYIAREYSCYHKDSNQKK